MIVLITVAILFILDTSATCDVEVRSSSRSNEVCIAVSVAILVVCLVIMAIIVLVVLFWWR